MNQLQTAGPELYRAVLLPQELLQMQDALAMAKDAAACKKAAHAIIEEFCSFFDRENVRCDMQLLLHGSFCNSHLLLLNDADERRNIFLFYEFTLVMMDALYVLHSKGEEK